MKSSSGWNMSPMRNTASSHDEVPSVDRAAFLGSRCSLSTSRKQYALHRNLEVERGNVHVQAGPFVQELHADLHT